MSEKKRASITFTKFTPYLVSGVKSITKPNGERIETENVVSLCRCGASKIKPYCDGTHNEIGLKGDKESGRRPDRIKDYRGDKITIHDNRGVCSHSEECIKNLPGVFRKEGRPWINADGGDNQSIIDTIHKCPSGALSYTINDKHYYANAQDTEIRMVKDGPYEVSGDVALNDDQGSEPANKRRYVLCRCNESRNKPFCDGSHHEVDFKD